MVTKTLLLLNMAVWALLAVIGIGSVLSIGAQGVPGYPNTGQFILYAAIPVLASSSAALLIWLHRVERVREVLGLAVLLSLGAVLPYVMISAGGV